MDGDLNIKMSEYNNKVYFGAWTTAESGDLQDAIQLRSLTFSSTKLGNLVSDEIVKNSYLPPGFGFIKKLEDVMHQANSLTLKSIGGELSIPQAHDSKRHQETVRMERLHILEEDLNQNIQRVLKQDSLLAKCSKNPDCTRHLQMEDISLDAAWTQELDTKQQKRKCISLFICQKNQVDLTHIRFNIKPRGRNIFVLSVLTHLFRSCNQGSMLPLVSPCSSRTPVIQHRMRDDRKKRKQMFQLPSDNPAVDSSHLRTPITAIMLSVNEQNGPLPVMSISLAEGGHILLLLSNT